MKVIDRIDWDGNLISRQIIDESEPDISNLVKYYADKFIRDEKGEENYENNEN